MASVYDLKPRFQAMLRPLVGGLAKLGVRPNHVTIAAVILSLAAGAVIVRFAQEKWPLRAMPAVLFLRMALNAVDGMLARDHSLKTALGAILNELADVVSDIALYLPLALVPGVSVKWIVIIVILGIVVEMTGVLACQIGAERRYDGPMGKSDRALVIGALCLLLGIGVIPAGWFNYVLMLVAALLLVSIVNRARGALKEVR
jgi:CDP-diacylglycerol--glycerol-3-phosphate 3-phosphatidyltransferase